MAHFIFPRSAKRVLWPFWRSFYFLPVLTRFVKLHVKFVRAFPTIGPVYPSNKAIYPAFLQCCRNIHRKLESTKWRGSFCLILVHSFIHDFNGLFVAFVRRQRRTGSTSNLAIESRSAINHETNYFVVTYRAGNVALYENVSIKHVSSAKRHESSITVYRVLLISKR